MRLRTRMLPVADQGLFRHIDRALAELDSAQQLGSRMLREAVSNESGDRVRKLRGILRVTQTAHRMLVEAPRLVSMAGMIDPDLQPEETKVAPVPKSTAVSG